MPLPLLVLALFQEHYVRVHDREVRGLDSPGRAVESAPGPLALAFPPVCDAFAAGRHGEAVPGGGTLSPGAFSNPATVTGGASARVAFVAQVGGAARNQGVFVHDGTTLTAVATGCGALGGGGSIATCGDPTPIGGTFGGFFTGTIFAPAVNAGGDVLFVADVVGGAAPRALFLHDASAGAVVKVAAPGDASPLGGTFAMVGPGTLNASGAVAFLASGSTAGPSDVFLWDGGAVTRVAAAGDAAPLGSTYQLLGTESFGFADGTTIPVGPVPDLADDGSVVFRAITAAGRRGIVRRTAAGASSWLVRDLEATPAGGTFLDFQSASTNAAGEIAFFADVRLGPSTFTSGWFAGAPGALRAALVFGDAVGGGTANGLAFSRNPMTPLDDGGNLLLWTDVLLPGGASREHLVVSAPDGALTIVARQTDATPLGGTYGTFDAWPSLDPGASGGGAYGASTPASGVLNAHFLFEACPAASASSRNGSGANAACFAAAPPVLGAAWNATVDATAHAGATATLVIARTAPFAGLFVAAGEILVDPGSPLVFTSVAAGSGLVVHPGAVPADPALAGLGASLQGLIVGGGAELCNAMDVVLGY